MSASGSYASPPCLAHEIDPTYFDPMATDLVQQRDVARWRRVERKRLSGLREALGQDARSKISTAICGQLKSVLAEHGIGPGSILSGYWPIKREPDLRPLFNELRTVGVELALPIVETKTAPLTFRRWLPGEKLERGDWGIPAPPGTAEQVEPDTVLAPCLGWTIEGFRLGWGGGYFDRTLAALCQRPLSIGIALNAAHIPTIYPQPHDIPLDLMVTETGSMTEMGGTSSSVSG